MNISYLNDSLEKPSHGKLTEYTTVNDTITYIPNPGHQGTDFFTYHMQLGSLHTNPVTVAITVTTPDEADRLGAGLSQTPSGSGFLSSRQNLSQSNYSAAQQGAQQHDGQSVDEESGSLVPPPPAAASGSASGTTTINNNNNTNASPAGGFNRKASYREPPSAANTTQGAAQGGNTLNRSNSSYASSPANPNRTFEMSPMGTSTSEKNTMRDGSVVSPRRAPSVSAADETARRTLLSPGEERRPPRNTSSTMEGGVSRRK